MTSAFLKPRVVVAGKSYSILNVIAEGALGIVSRVKSVNVSTLGQHFALKKMTCQDAEQVTVARKEIALMQLLAPHPNIISLVDSEMTESRPGLVLVHVLMPYYPTSLQGLLEESGAGGMRCCFNDGQVVLTILRNVADGLEHMHSRGYRHADLKPGNVLLSLTGPSTKAVIADLGSACPLVVRCSSRQQALTIQEEAAIATTAPYRSPELWDTPNECTIDGKADVWGFGCTMYALLFSRSPFEPPGAAFSPLAVLSGSFRFPTAHTWSHEYLDAVSGCLTVDPSARLGLPEVLHRLHRLPANNNLSRQAQVAAAEQPYSAAPQVSLEGELPTLPPPLPPRVKSRQGCAKADKKASIDVNLHESVPVTAFADFSQFPSLASDSQQVSQQVEDEFGDFVVG